jgi:hypothetical protein
LSRTKFTCSAESLGSLRGDCERQLTTLSNVNTPSTIETDVGCACSVRVWRKQPLLCTFVPGVVIAKAISNFELLQRATLTFTVGGPEAAFARVKNAEFTRTNE